MSKGHHFKSRTGSNFWLSCLFSFFISLTLVLGTVAMVVHFALSERIIIKVSQDEAYCEAVLQDIEDKAYDYTLPTDIDQAVVGSMFDFTEVKDDISLGVKDSFNGGSGELNTDMLRKRFETRVKDFYSQSGKLTDQMDEIIGAYANDIAKMYIESVKIIGINYIITGSRFYARYFPFVLMVLVLMDIMFCIICVRLHHYLHRGLRFVAYSVAGASLILFVGPLVLYISKIYTRISVSFRPFYQIVVSYIEYILRMLFIASLGWFIIMLAIVVFISIKRTQLVKKSFMALHNR